VKQAIPSKAMLRIFKISIILFIFCGTMPAQVQNDPGIEKWFKKALSHQRKGEDRKALKLYEKIIRKDSSHIKSYLQVAGIHYNKKRFEDAEVFLGKAIAMKPGADPEMYLSMALVKEEQMKREEAISYYTEYLSQAGVSEERRSRAEKRIKTLGFIIKATENPVPFDPVDPGPGINTKDPEYLASVNVAGDMMVFTRRVNRQEDLFISRLVDGSWQPAEPVSDLNTSGNEAAHCLSPDGRTLVFTQCERRTGFGSCDLYESRWDNGKWSRPRNLGPMINSRSWDSQPSITSDGNMLFFSSSRPGGQGGRDIWYSKRDSLGNWTLAQNAGPPVNTKGNEQSPFIHPDHFTLYFMSDGHVGMGGDDLFVSFHNGWTWGEPINLGFPVNTEKDEGAIRVAADGVTAYMSTDRFIHDNAVEGDLDIYSFRLNPEVRAQAVGYVKGKVYDKQKLLPLHARVTLSDNRLATKISTIETDEHGVFLVPLPGGKKYHFKAEAPGYVFQSAHFDLEEDSGRAFELDIGLWPIVTDSDQPSEAVVLPNIFFETGSARLNLKESYLDLLELALFLKDNPEVRIQILGHTDNVGSERDNLALSTARAQVVRDQLTNMGIDPFRIEYIGLGESSPVASNDTEEGRQMNRRTEFIILTGSRK